MHDYLVHGLSLAITLGIRWKGISVPDAKVVAKFTKSLTIELQSIIRYKGVWNPKFGDYILPHKFLHIHIPEISQSFRLCPFGEVIDSYQNESSIARCSGKWAEDIKPLLCEGQGLLIGFKWPVGW